MRGLLTATALALGSLAAAGQPQEVLVSAAVSLSGVLQEAAGAYRKQGGDQVVLNFAASNILSRQIQAGAGVDMFISADELQMDAVEAEITPGTRVDLLSNQLAVVVADDLPGSLEAPRDLTAAFVRRIAIGDPAGVPAGVYARQYLEQVGLWSTLQPKIVPSGSVRLALAAVENGAAEAAIVYRTDVTAARRVRLAVVVPRADGPSIVYPAALIRSGGNPAGARRFLAFLQSAAGAAIFSRAGFTPVAR